VDLRSVDNRHIEDSLNSARKTLNLALPDGLVHQGTGGQMVPLLRVCGGYPKMVHEEIVTSIGTSDFNIPCGGRSLKLSAATDLLFHLPLRQRAKAPN